MIALLPRPAILTGLVVAASLATGLAMGAALASAGLTLHVVRRNLAGGR